MAAPRLGAEVRGGERRGCSEGEAGPGVRAPHATGRRCWGPGCPRGLASPGPAAADARACVCACVWGARGPPGFRGVPAPRGAGGGTLSPRDPVPSERRPPWGEAHIPFLPLVNDSGFRRGSAPANSCTRVSRFLRFRNIFYGACRWSWWFLRTAKFCRVFPAKGGFTEGMNVKHIHNN